MLIHILNVKVDSVTLDQSADQIMAWVSDSSQHKRVVVTPNVEFLIAAQKDAEFRDILNDADLAIPDSSRFGWLQEQTSKINPVKKFLKWWLFPFSNKIGGYNFPVVTGIDLMNELCRRCADQGYSVGLLGGADGVATLAATKLREQFPTLNITFADPGGRVGSDGIMNEELRIKNSDNNGPHSSFLIPNSCDILFVAYGQVKQEKFINRYKDQLPAKVFMGVGGSFDYVAGVVSRAPKIVRNLGLEWLWRLINQPWRITRQFQLLVLIVKLLFGVQGTGDRDQESR